jgi:hypothetical protein
MALYNGVNKIKLTRTRYAGLAYGNTNPAGTPLWRFVDVHEGEDKARTVGPQYGTKTELLADLERYAKSWGY